MSELSNNAMPKIDLALAEIGKEELQKRTDEAGGFACGKGIRRKKIDGCQPENDGNPVFNQENAIFVAPAPNAS
jgi:hypothetical protein